MVKELQVFEMHLNSRLPDDKLLRQIDRGIPYHILFLLEYQGKYQARIGYKKVSESGTKVLRIGNYYHTDWCSEQELSLVMEGVSVDQVYENYVRQIAGEQLNAETSGECLKDSVERSEQKQALQKQIDALQRKIRKEKQLNKQLDMNHELKKLQKELEVM